VNLESRSCELLWMCGGAATGGASGVGRGWGVWGVSESALGRESTTRGIDGLSSLRSYPWNLELQPRSVQGRRRLVMCLV
jgi:hypothetical protein